MRAPTWVAVAAVGIQAPPAVAGMATGDQAIGMLAGLMTSLPLGAIAYAVVSWRDRPRHP